MLVRHRQPPLQGGEQFHAKCDVPDHSEKPLSQNGELVMRTVLSGYTSVADHPASVHDYVYRSATRCSHFAHRDTCTIREACNSVDSDDSECSRYFLGSKKDGGLQPILDLRPLNSALSLCSFKIITIKQIRMHVQPRDLLISVDLLSPLDSPSLVLSEICIRGRGLSVSDPALQPVSGTMHVHKMHGCCT